jgi:hypothetical protein
MKPQCPNSRSIVASLIQFVIPANAAVQALSFQTPGTTQLPTLVVRHFEGHPVSATNLFSFPK